jgi:hypothetical protein
LRSNRESRPVPTSGVSLKSPSGRGKRKATKSSDVPKRNLPRLDHGEEGARQDGVKQGRITNRDNSNIRIRYSQ